MGRKLTASDARGKAARGRGSAQPTAKVPPLPLPIERSIRPMVLDGEGWWLVLGDIHIPYHDLRTVELAIREAIRRTVVGVILNGDILDSHELSRFDKSPDDPRYRDEIAAGKALAAHLRGKLPRAQIVWKEGNHEERLYSYLINRAPALFGIEALSFPSLLQLPQHGIVHVADKRVIRLGKLNIIHGHEYRPMIATPVNHARGVFLRAKSAALAGHFHQTSEHHEPTITGKPQGAWSVGCACDLAPRYMPLNKWNLGFALVHVGRGGEFSVENKRVIGGEMV